MLQMLRTRMYREEKGLRSSSSSKQTVRRTRFDFRILMMPAAGAEMGDGSGAKGGRLPGVGRHRWMT